MTKKINRRGPAPIVWEGSYDDLAAHRAMGVLVVLHGADLVLDLGETRKRFVALSHWFTRAEALKSDRIGRLACDHCRSIVGCLNLIWQPGRESVVEIEYQQRALADRGDEMAAFRALLHPAADHCVHGALVMHPAESIEVHCRSHDLVLTGKQVLDVVRRSGGWDAGRVPPRPLRVALH